MANASFLLSVLVVNPARMVPPRPKPGMNQFEVQDAECLLLNDDGSPKKVGVLRLSDDLRKQGITPGNYVGAFALDVSWKDRTVEAQLVGLTPVDIVPGKGAVPKAPAKAPGA